MQRVCDGHKKDLKGILEITDFERQFLEKRQATKQASLNGKKIGYQISEYIPLQPTGEKLAEMNGTRTPLAIVGYDKRVSAKKLLEAYFGETMFKAPFDTRGRHYSVFQIQQEDQSKQSKVDNYVWIRASDMTDVDEHKIREVVDAFKKYGSYREKMNWKGCYYDLSKSSWRTQMLKPAPIRSYWRIKSKPESIRNVAYFDCGVNLDIYRNLDYRELAEWINGKRDGLSIFNEAPAEPVQTQSPETVDSLQQKISTGSWDTKEELNGILKELGISTDRKTVRKFQLVKEMMQEYA